MKRFLYIPLCLLIAAVFIISCDKNDNDSAEAQTLDSYLSSQSDLSLYKAALLRAGLQSYIDGPGPFTFFAPTNEAMTAAMLTLDSINKMTPGAINYLLMYHILNSQVTTIDMLGAQVSFARGTQIGNSGSTQIFLGRVGDTSYVNGVTITRPDNMVKNGTVHVINKFLMPPVLKGTVQNLLTNSGQHNLFIAALTKANRWTALNTTTNIYTIFAPTDAAMTAAGFTTTAINTATVSRIDSLVRYHYINSSRLFTNDLGNRETPQTALGVGRTLTASGNGTRIKGRSNSAPANIINGNNLGNNGVVHTIDGVLQY